MERTTAVEAANTARRRAFEEMIASFAYKGKEGDVEEEEGHEPPKKPQRRRRRREGEEGPRKSESRRQKKSTPSPFIRGPRKSESRRQKKSTPSPFIRVNVGDKTVVVSKWFPLPEGASNPVVLDWEEIERARRRRRSQLSNREKFSDAYRRVAVDSAWKPPLSPYNLLQESHSFDPWRVLVICMLLNVTTGKQVQNVLPRLFHLCPNAETTIGVPEEEIEEVIQTLGVHRRARAIKIFSSQYLQSDWTHVTQLHGVGKYAADAYAIFCAGKADAVVPEDHKLIDYWKFICAQKQAECLSQKRKS